MNGNRTFRRCKKRDADERYKLTSRRLVFLRQSGLPIRYSESNGYRQLPQFISQLFSYVCAILGIKRIPITLYKPYSTGQQNYTTNNLQIVNKIMQPTIKPIGTFTSNHLQCNTKGHKNWDFTVFPFVNWKWARQHPQIDFSSQGNRHGLSAIGVHT